MSIYRRWLQAVLAASLIVLVVIAWIVFAPIQLGGQAAYVIVTGNSMEPDFHSGDLVIVRGASVYQVGDIVAYRDAELGRYIFHRIVELEQDRFILKGDHNAWIDSYQPTREELIGKSWILLPLVGKVVQGMRLPINTALIAGVLGGILMAAVLLGRSRRGRGMSKNSSNLGGIVEGIFFVLGLLAIASLILSFYAFNRPLWRTVMDNVQYQHIGLFFYTATVPPGIYDSETVHTGEPVFPTLTCTINLGFGYTLMGDQLQDLVGTHQLTAEVIDDQSGWQRTIPLQPETTFSGNSYVTNAILDLCQVEALVQAVEKETGFHPSYYTLAITPHVTITGKAAGRELQDTFEPRLVFRFDDMHFYLARDNSQVDPLSPSKTGLIMGSRTEANTFPLLGIEPKVSEIRIYSLIGLSLSLSGMLILGLYVFIVAQHGQESFVRMKYGPLLVDVQDNRGLETSSRAIDVVSMDDLAKLAERHNSMILHEARGPTHYYLVQGDGISYRYAISEGRGGLLAGSLMQLQDDMQRGLEREEFQVHYQPIVSLTDGKIIAVEALLRWQHPQRGLVPAAEFIPAAEATGLIEPMGEWMLGVACAQIKNWQEAGILLTLAVNLSERQLEGDPAKTISRVLQNTGMDPHSLQIEIPETRVIDSAYKILPQLQELKNLGIQISMDNSVGQFPLSSLGRFLINTVKIDRPFIERIRNPEDATTIRRMIATALKLGLNVTAEGVETEEQLGFLRSQSCTLAQGYLLGRPAPAQTVTQLLRRSRSPVSPGPLMRPDFKERIR